MQNFLWGFSLGAIVVGLISVVTFYFLLRFLKRETALTREQDLNNSRDKLQESTRSVMEQGLTPFKERLMEYQKTIEENFSQEAKERFAMGKELERLMQLNQQMEMEARNLTTALKGDVKVQGNWGEIVLERVLEASGLRKGEEFIPQAEGMGIKSEDGRSQRPDIVIRLPDEHHIIIDSKVSLKSYVEYTKTESKQEQEAQLKDLKRSLQAHVDGLAAKTYHNLEGVKSPDFVFMFVPIEGAYILAFQNFPEIYEYAWKKNIVIATSSTLMGTLRTVATLWRVDRQSKNAEEIARKGGLIYDKIVSFCEDFDKLGESLARYQKQYDETSKKLYAGRGNIVNRAEELRELGAKSTKSFQ